MIKVIGQPATIDQAAMDTFLEVWIPRLGLDEWQITIEFTTLEEELGSCRHNFHGQQVHILLNADLERHRIWSGDVYQTIYHELIHVTQSPFIKLLTMVRDELIGQQGHGWFDELVRQAAEQQVELLARALHG